MTVCSAGSYDVMIETWRPVTPSPKCEMMRYFIGGTPQLEDLASSLTSEFTQLFREKGSL